MKLTLSPRLERAIPLLEQAWLSSLRNDGLYPIFSNKQLLQAWKQFPARIPASRGAAVLVPVCSFENKPSILFTKRSSHLNSHSSEISFPGGHVEPSDESLVDAALRETREEIVTPLEPIFILGTATAVPSIKGTPVTPVLAVLPYEMEQDMLFGNSQEVESVFCRSIESLLEDETSRHLGRLGRPAPVFPTPHGDIWGLTAFVLQPILHKLLRPVFQEVEANDQ
jgi:nudix motif 8